MKLISFYVSTPLGPVTRVGALEADREKIIDLRGAYAAYLVTVGVSIEEAKKVAGTLFGDMVGFIALGDWGRQQAEMALSYASTDRETSPLGERMVFGVQEIRLLAPLRPRSLRDCIAFEQHIQNSYERLNGQDVPPVWYEMPVYYKGNPFTVVGPDDEVRWPSYSEAMDYELELGIVVGPGNSDVPMEEAKDYIYGLTIINDFSARDIQEREMTVGLGPSKGKDFATALGPWLVTRDEIPDFYALEMIARVNGAVWSQGNSKSIYWRFDQMIHHASLGEELRPGDVIASGTVGGGCGLELGRFLESGDLVELEVSHLGVLRNRVTKETVATRAPSRLATGWTATDG